MNSDDDLDFLTYINSNNKLVNSSENKDNPPKKRMKMSQSSSKFNLTSRDSKVSQNNEFVFSVEKINTENSFVELVLKRLNVSDEHDLEARCYLFDSW